MSKQTIHLVDAKDASKMLGIGRRLLWQMTNRREIPHHRFGRAVRYDVRDLESWLHQRKIQATDL